MQKKQLKKKEAIITKFNEEKENKIITRSVNSRIGPFRGGLRRREEVSGQLRPSEAPRKRRRRLSVGISSGELSCENISAS